MIKVKPDQNADRISLIRVENISQKLANDIASGIHNYVSEQAKWPWAPATIRTALGFLIPSLCKVIPALPIKFRRKFVKSGIDAISNEDTWAILLGSIYECYEKDRQLGFVVESFHKFIALHRRDPNLKRFSNLEVRGGHSDLSNLYQVSPEFLIAYKRLILKFDSRGEIKTSTLLFKHRTYSLLSLLIKDEQAKKWLAAEGFDAFAKHPDLLEMVERHRTWQAKPSITQLLAEHDPLRWKRKTIKLHGKFVDLTKLFTISEAIFRDIETFASMINASPPKGKKIRTIIDSLTGIQRVLTPILEVLPEAARAAIKGQGLSMFIENKCQLLSEAYQAYSLDRAHLSYIKEVTDTLFPDRKLDVKELLPYQLAFKNNYSARPIFCDFAPIRAISVALYDDLTALLTELQAILPQKNFDTNTVYHHYTQLKAVLVMFSGEIEQDYAEILREHGMKAFDLPGHKLQKFIFANLQNAQHNNSLTTHTAYTYKNSVIWFITQFGFQVVDAYTITISRTEKHKKRLNTDDYYSAEQCRELAFHIESLLAESDVLGEHRIALLLARVLLKTGWNLSPTLGIQCQDIIRTATPLNPNGIVAIVLRKARAGYRSDAYTFNDPTTNISAMRSAVADLIHIRDDLTASLRSSLPESNPYKHYIFLIERKGEPQRLSMAATKIVTEMLSKRGCTLTLDSKKIRKGGINHLYRQVQKDLREYEAAAKHDFKTFESSYYRIDENQSRYVLGKAVDVMGRYFTGKQISSDIVIVTAPNATFQHTPAGECASAGNDEESERYALEHKRLLSARGVAAQFCADFLSCIWCKYFRLVADPEHAWKLLSYREYLLHTMESSVMSDDATDDQQAYIDILKGRIADMLTRLEQMTQGIVEQGQELLRRRGMHPDWSFAIADSPLSQSR